MTTLVEKLDQFPSKTVDVNGRKQAYRESGSGQTLILLHGISSGSGSWVNQLGGLKDHYHVIAWDAPGYGESEKLSTDTPTMLDYGEAIFGMMKALNLDNPIILGHSLGAMMVAGFNHQYGDHLKAMMLANPAQGYGWESAEAKEEIYHRRPTMLKKLGANGMADERGPFLLAPGASEEKIDLVRYSMNRLQMDGFTNASYLLSHDDIWKYLGDVPKPIGVIYGEEDGITKPEGVRELISKLQKSRAYPLANAGHASYIDEGEAFNQSIIDFDKNYK